ncbi:MAG: acyltransferase [Bacteroidales bacterium]|nr:acyltransferase [Bacteroidales bacterium]
MKLRLFYVDYIRLLLCCIVIFHHVIMGFCSIGGWYYDSPVQVEGTSRILCTIILGINQSYFMSLFFFVSALFTPVSLDKKGVAGFVRDRFFRLGVPLLVYVFGIHPLLVKYVWGMGAEYQYQLGPLWFVFALLFFEMAYILVRKINIKIGEIKINSRTMTIFVVVTGLLTFALRTVVRTNQPIMGITFANFVLYVAMYIIGILASRQKLLDTLTVRRSCKWMAIAFVMWVLMLGISASHPEDTSGGLNVTSLVYSVWEAVSCVAVSYFLLAIGRRYFNRQHTFWESAAADSFLAFVIHPFPVVFLTQLVESAGLSPEVLIPITAIVAIMLSFVVAHVLRWGCHTLNYKWV